MVERLLLKELINTIKKNFIKFISLVSIIALGIGFYVGMKSSIPIINDSISKFYDNNQMYDLLIYSDRGITTSELEEVKNTIENVSETEGAFRADIITNIKSTEVVISVLSMNKNSKINQLKLLSGKLPTRNNECVIDEKMLKKGIKIGDYIEIKNSVFKNKTVEIVGVVNSPLYIANSRGTTNLLSGQVSYFLYVLESNFDLNTYTMGYVKLENKYTAFSDDYLPYINEIKDNIIASSQELSYIRTKEIIEEYENEIKEYETEYNQKKSEALSELKKAEDAINDYQQQINTKYKEIKTDAEIKQMLVEKKKYLDNLKSKLEAAKKELDDYASKISSSEVLDYKNQKSTIAAQINELNKTKSECEENLKYYQDKKNTSWSRISSRMYDYYIELYQKQLNEINKEIESKKQKLSEIEMFISQYENGNEQYKSYKIAYESNLNAYNKALTEYQTYEKNIYNQMHEAKVTLDKKQEELNNKKKELEEEKQKQEAEFDKAALEIADKKDQLEKIKNASWTIKTRNDNDGYNQIKSDLESVNNLSSIFPIVFFFVSCLVTLTTMSKMIDFDRIQIGTLSALGIKKKKIICKYLLYALFSVIIGGIIGSLLGTLIIPLLIYKIYGLMYKLPPICLSLKYFFIVIGFIYSGVGTLLITYLIAKKTIKFLPCYLLRPASPPAGKRIILEKLTFIWKRLNFFNKATMRNLFRYKKRALMTICGVSACMVLIVGALGLKNSISDIIYKQYQDIFTLDIEAFYKEDMTRTEIATENEKIKNYEEIKNIAPLHLETINLKNDEKNYMVYLVSTENQDELNNVMKLNDLDNNKITLSDNGVVLTKKIAQLLDIKVGDEFVYYDSNNNEYTVRLENICEHYVEHYMYMSANYYEKLKNNTPKNNVLAIEYNSGVDELEVIKKINTNHSFSNMKLLSMAKEIYDEVTKNLNYIVILVVISSGLLFFIVLYNLAILNIEERKREIASLKVLGFNKKEINQYIIKEMNILTTVGIIIGCLIGTYFAKIIINSCEIDMLSYINHIPLKIYILGILLNGIFTIVVGYFTSKKLEKLNMLDSLKSVE